MGRDGEGLMKTRRKKREINNKHLRRILAQVRVSDMSGGNNAEMQRRKADEQLTATKRFYGTDELVKMTCEKVELAFSLLGCSRSEMSTKGDNEKNEVKAGNENDSESDNNSFTSCI